MESTVKFEKGIAVLYVLCLPIRMLVPFGFLQNYVGGCALNFDFFFHIIGLALWFFQGGRLRLTKKGRNLLIGWIVVVCTLVLISAINAARYYYRFGMLYGEDSISAIVGQVVYWLQYVLMVLYNIRVFYLLTMHNIWKLIGIISNIMLLVGYFQIAVVVFRADWFCRLYDFIASDVLFLQSDYLLNEKRIVLSTTEPAYASYMIIRLFLPLLLTDIIINGMTKRNFVKLLFWMPVIYYTKSSNMYILFCVELLVFIVIKCGRILREKRITLNFISGLMLFGGLAVLSSAAFGGIRNMTSILYILRYKLTDRTNMSTAWRIAPIYVNWEIFKRFPIWGIGNGNQGFFFWDFFPEWAYDLLKNTRMMEWNSNEMTNGILFFPSILSGYGLVGSLILLGYFFTLALYMIKEKHSHYKEFCFFFIAIAGIVVNGFSADFAGAFDVWFVLSIPFGLAMIPNTIDGK